MLASSNISVGTGERPTAVEACPATQTEIFKYTAKAPTECASNYSFKPRPLRGLAHALSCSTPLGRCASRLNSGVRQPMRNFSYFILTALLASCSTGAGQFSPSDFIRVSCSSEDGGKTCYGYGEIYSDGTSDSCGRVPDGPEFAMKLRYEISGNSVCETVVKTTDPKTMPVGDRFCAIYLEREPHDFTYRFSNDPPTKTRHSYTAKRADKWCQNLIDGLH